MSYKIREGRLYVYHYSYYSMDWNLIFAVTLKFNNLLIVDQRFKTKYAYSCVH